MIRHLAFLLLVPLLALAASTPPKPEGAYRPPEGHVWYSPGPVGKAVLVPDRFARESAGIVDCEDRGRQAWDAVGEAGERGPFQIHVVHISDMRGAGLDFDSESDRILWAVELWKRSGWRDWRCKR